MNALVSETDGPSSSSMPASTRMNVWLNLAFILMGMAALAGLYLAAYFCMVERSIPLASMHTENRSGAVSARPSLEPTIMVMTIQPHPSYPQNLGAFFGPAHYLDQAFFRPELWAVTRTEHKVSRRVCGLPLPVSPSQDEQAEQE